MAISVKVSLRAILVCLVASACNAGFAGVQVRNNYILKTSSTELSIFPKKQDSFSAVRARSIVAKDEKTGAYKRVSSSGEKKQESIASNREEEEDTASVWDMFKNSIYNVVDKVSSVTKKKQTNSIKNRKISNAYSDTVELKRRDTNLDTPVAKIMAEYDVSLKANSSLKTNHDVSTGENLFMDDKRKMFEEAKDSVYSLVDAIFKNNDQKSTKKAPISTISYKAPTKISVNLDTPVQVLTEQMDDLNSSNPLKRFYAKLAIEAEERKLKRRFEEEKRKNEIEKAKQTVYGFIDTVKMAPDRAQTLVTHTVENVQNTIYEIKKTPMKISSAVEKTVGSVQSTVEEIQKTPDKINQAVEDTKASIENTKKSIENAVQEVQSIPTKVETRILETKRSIEETKESVEQIFERVEDMAFQAKVLAGLERPKPKPPPPPPPPKTATDIALDTGIGIAKLTGKATVALAKGTVGLGVSGIKLAWSKLRRKDANGSKNISSPTPTPQKSKGMTDTINTLKSGSNVPMIPSEDIYGVLAQTLADIDPLLDNKITEALRSAEAALDAKKQSKKIQTDKNTGVLTIEINEAVRKAKEAAELARKDADELEAMMNERATRS